MTAQQELPRRTLLRLGIATAAGMLLGKSTDRNAEAYDGPWGKAGRAPQDTGSAAEALQVPEQDRQLLTVLFPHPGDPTAIGWVLGTSSTEAGGQWTVRAERVPAGVCVDFDPGASSLNGNVEWQVDFGPNWRRTLLKEDGAFRGRKATFYWTPCSPNQ